LISVELSIWNKERENYDEPAERMIFQLNEYSGRFTYLVFQKGDKYEELVNNINYDRDLLAKLYKK
jgi:hypothetical protein